MFGGRGAAAKALESGPREIVYLLAMAAPGAEDDLPPLGALCEFRHGDELVGASCRKLPLCPAVKVFQKHIDLLVKGRDPRFVDSYTAREERVHDSVKHSGFPFVGVCVHVTTEYL